MDNGIGHTQTAEHDAKKVEDPRCNNRQVSWHRLGIDNRCYRVGGIVKAVDKFIGKHKKNGQYQTD